MKRLIIAAIALVAAGTVLAEAPLQQLVITDTVPPRLDPRFPADHLTVLDSTGLIAAAIRAIHENGSLVSLMEDHE